MMRPPNAAVPTWYMRVFIAEVITVREPTLDLLRAKYHVDTAMAITI